MEKKKQKYRSRREERRAEGRGKAKMMVEKKDIKMNEAEWMVRLCVWGW